MSVITNSGKWPPIQEKIWIFSWINHNIVSPWIINIRFSFRSHVQAKKNVIMHSKTDDKKHNKILVEIWGSRFSLVTVLSNFSEGELSNTNMRCLLFSKQKNWLRNMALLSAFLFSKITTFLKKSLLFSQAPTHNVISCKLIVAWLCRTLFVCALFK